jgi:hypothetical protein
MRNNDEKMKMSENFLGPGLEIIKNLGSRWSVILLILLFVGLMNLYIGERKRARKKREIFIGPFEAGTYLLRTKKRLNLKWI